MSGDGAIPLAGYSVDTGLGTHFADIRVASQQKTPVRFTFFWTEAQRWEGREVEVRA